MIAIVDYNAGNLTSVELALKYLNHKAEVTCDRDTILQAERVIFPGVGAAGASMENLKDRELVQTLWDFVETGKPMLGICVGAQVILESSLEDNNTECMGLLPGTTGVFKSTVECPIKIPQIGWNQVDYGTEEPKHAIFQDIPNQSDFYFVHSYYPLPKQVEWEFAHTTYGDTRFASVIGKGNLVACQFHPEKSGKWGLKLIDNFCRWNPC
jgi:glutamine amidotransferase